MQAQVTKAAMMTGYANLEKQVDELKKQNLYLYLDRFNQLSFLLLLVESSKDDSVYVYIRPCLGRVISISPFNWDFIAIVVSQVMEN